MAKKLNFLPRILTGPSRDLVQGEVRPTGGVGPGSSQFRGGWFFEPMAPTAPLAPAQQRPRRFEYVPGHNLLWVPREGVGISFGMLRSLSYSLDVLRVVIEMVKASVRGLDWEVRPIRKQGEKRSEYAARIKDDAVAAQLTEFWKFPDGQQNFDSWLNEALEEILVIDAWSVYLEQDKSGKIANVKNVDGATIFPLVDVEGYTPRPPAPAFYQTLYGAPAFLLTTDELIYSPANRVFRGPAGGSDMTLYGYPPVEFVLLTINQLLRQEVFNLDFFQQGNLPEAIAGVPSNWSPKQIEELQNWFDALETGNHGERRKLRFIPTVAGGAGERMNIVFPKIQEWSFKSEYPEFLTRIISAAFRVSHQWVAKMMSRASSEEASSLSEVMGTSYWTTHVAATINAVIQRKMELADYEFAFHARQESDPEKAMTVGTGYVKTGVITVNEQREDLGRDPYDVPEASVPLVYTATGPVPLSPPEPPEGSPSNQPGQLGEKPQNGKPPSGPPQKPGKKPAPASQDTEKRGRKIILNVDESNPFLSRARETIRKQMHLANHEYQKQLLESPALEELGKLSKQDDEQSKKEREALIAAILAVLTNHYAKRQKEFKEAIEEAGKAGILIGAREGATLVPREQKKLAEKASEYAEKQSAELVTGIDDTTRKRLKTILKNAFDEGYSGDELEQRISDAGVFSDWRARMIARTETGNAMARSNLETWKLSGAAEYVEWTVGDDPCPICEENAGEVRKIGEAFPSGDDSPLVHPSCECSLVVAEDQELESVAKRGQANLLLMRHGATPLNEQNRLRGQSASPLDAEGRKTVAKTAEALKDFGIRKIVSSKVARARQSAAIVGKVLGVPVEYDEDLNSWDTGKLVGLPSEAIKPYIDDPDLAPPNGETLNDLRKRATKAVAKHEKEADKDGPILGMTHNSVMLAVQHDRTGRRSKHPDSDPVPPAGVAEVRKSGLKKILPEEQ
jgi:broad specificity phosphatase PhoE